MRFGRIRRTGFAAILAATAIVALGAPAAQASLNWDQPAYDFGNVAIGDTASKTFTLTASCDAGLGIGPPDICTTPAAGVHMFGSPATEGDGFAIGTPNTCVPGQLSTPLFPGAMTCQTTVTFSPTSAGLRNGKLDTTSADVSLTGIGGTSTTTGGGGGGGGGDKGGVKKKKCKKKGKKRSAATATPEQRAQAKKCKKGKKK